ITNVKTSADIDRVAAKIVEECSRPLSFSGTSYSLGLSMGIAVFPDDCESIEDLVNKADSAMYHVKHQDKNAYAFCNDSAHDISSVD
ncbi:MAG: diguanylate cyclase, partial [Spirochaetales bacterium]|nr:diguanylate cyclase [Spirochaetales bacterium]